LLAAAAVPAADAEHQSDGAVVPASSPLHLDAVSCVLLLLLTYIIKVKCEDDCLLGCSGQVCGGKFPSSMGAPSSGGGAGGWGGGGWGERG
jgi:hypothetical protein